MDLLGRLFLSAASHVVLLLVVLPAFGAILVRIMRRADSESVYYTAVTNAWTGLSLAVLMLVMFLTRAGESGESGSADAPRDRLVSAIHWHGELQPAPDNPPDSGSTTPPTEKRRVTIGPDVRFRVGVSGVSVWLIVLTVTVSVVLVQSQPRDDKRLVARLSWILLTEAALIGTLAALDIVLLSFCSLLSVVGLTFLIGEFGGRDRREAARRFLVGQLASGMLLTIGLLGLAISHWWVQVSEDVQHPDLTFSLTTILAQLPFFSTMTEPALDFWNTVAPWLFLMIGAGLFLRLPIVPLHHGWLRVAEHADRRVVALIAVGYLPAVIHLQLRILLPLFPGQSADLGGRLLVWGAAGSVILALIAAATNSRPRRLAAVALSVSTIALGSSFLQISGVVQGAALATIGISAAVALALLCHAEPSSASDDADSSSGPRQLGPATREGISKLSFAGLSLVPPTAGFWGAFLMLEGLFQYDSTIAFWLLASFALLGWTMWDEFSSREGSFRRGANRDSDSQSGETSRPRLPIPTLIPLVAVLIGVSVFPGAVLDHLAVPDRTDKEAAAAHRTLDWEFVTDSGPVTGEPRSGGSM